MVQDTERVGLDVALAMVKLRGFDGEHGERWTLTVPTAALRRNGRRRETFVPYVDDADRGTGGLLLNLLRMGPLAQGTARRLMGRGASKTSVIPITKAVTTVA